MKRVMILAALAAAVVLTAFGAMDGERARAGSAPLDDLKCYSAIGFPAVHESVFTSDQFNEKENFVKRAVAICNPVTKGGNSEAAGFRRDSVVCYKLDRPEQVSRTREIDNQLGRQTLEIDTAERLCIETEKHSGSDPSAAGGSPIDALKCYKARAQHGSEHVWPTTRFLEDQYDEKHSIILWPVSICVRVDWGFGKGSTGTVAGGGGDNQVLVCYRTFQSPGRFRFELIFNEFGPQLLFVYRAESVCLSSDKFED